MSGRRPPIRQAPRVPRCMRYPCIDHGRPRVPQQDRRRIIFYYGHGFEVLIEYRSGGSDFDRKPKFKLRHCRKTGSKARPGPPSQAELPQRVGSGNSNETLPDSRLLWTNQFALLGLANPESQPFTTACSGQSASSLSKWMPVLVRVRSALLSGCFGVRDDLRCS